MSKEREALSVEDTLKLALEALTATMSTHGFRDAIEELQDKAITAIKASLEAHKALAQPSGSVEQEYTGAEFYSKEYWEGHDAAVRGVAMRWEQALTALIPNSGVMNEPLESLYRRTEALRMAQPKEPEQEPVAWMRKDETCTDCFVWQRTDEHTIPLYTTPPYVPTERQRTWVGLSLQEQAKILASIPDIPFDGEWHVILLNTIEAKLKEKNT